MNTLNGTLLLPVARVVLSQYPCDALLITTPQILDWLVDFLKICLVYSVTLYILHTMANTTKYLENLFTQLQYHSKKSANMLYIMFVVYFFLPFYTIIRC